MRITPMWLIDFYKVGHVWEYPEDTEYVYSNWTPRSTHVENGTHTVFFGLQYFIKEILGYEWDVHFFNVNLKYILKEYREVIAATLGDTNPKTSHIEALHKLGYLPLDIYAIPEGFSVPLKVPMLVIKNTLPEFFWLPNYFETILSNILWKPCTSATTAQTYRKIFTKYALESGETDLSFIDWQGHDFSFRGMAGREDAVLSGMGHLLSFSGTDTIPAIIAMHDYYGAPYSCGGSVAATEHSVMCAGLKENERDTFLRLMTKVHPTGVLSIVSDTWDLWKVMTEIIPSLKDVILARDGKIVIRPDSGDPVKILCGDPEYYNPRKPFVSSKGAGTLRLLSRALGLTRNRQGLPLITKAGVIYGDSITPKRADEILSRTVRELKLSPYNVVLGIGSYTYEYVTRDTYGFAMKATAVQRNGVLQDIYKDPVTDSGTKKSLKGIPAVYRTEESTEEKPDYFVKDGSTPESLDNCAFNKVYSDGMLIYQQTYDQIKNRVRA